MIGTGVQQDIMEKKQRQEVLEIMHVMHVEMVLGVKE